jgi:phage-related minor tail protein
MTDYYPVPARAVARLAVNNAQTRQDLYEHARMVLVAELERNNPERSTQAVLRERIDFETTVLRVEANSQLGYEKSRATLRHRLHAVRKQGKEPTSATGSDFASLLRWPAPACLRR